MINIFNEIDVNKDQTLTAQELDDAFKKIGIKTNQKDLKDYYDFIGISIDQPIN